MKRKVATIEQYDYSSKEEFEKHKVIMEEKGYTLIRDEFNGVLKYGILTHDDTWKYTACFIKSDLM